MATRTTTKRQPGTKRERSPGHWQLRVFNGYDPVTGNPRQATRTFAGTERQASKELAALVTEPAGKFDRTSATVGELLDKWLELGERPAAPDAVREPKEGRRPDPSGARRGQAERAPPRQARCDVPEMARRGTVADDRAQAPLDPLGRLRQAVKWGWIERAPTARATPPRAKRPMHVPTAEQLSTLVRRPRPMTRSWRPRWH